MGERTLYLAYSATPSTTANAKKVEWVSGNARQLSLFEDSDKIRVVLVSLSEVNAYSFRDVLSEKNPVLIIDTRLYPEFFNIFPSLDAAFADFQAQGIEYKRIPLGFKANEVWENLKELKRVFGEYFENHTGAPVLLLASTPKRAAQFATKVPGYLSQEVAETVLEQFP